ncbi:MAG: DNA adenine methylase [Campylobacterales bacterium]|nr:DNA adenine methylase [Campylobacterales bacterium]
MTAPTLYPTKPFLKWVGGKRALVDEIIGRMPERFGAYFEPFVGGGALFFELKKVRSFGEQRVYLLYENSESTNTYKAM